MQVSTKELGSFVTTIPELVQRIAKLQVHMDIGFALIEQIKARQLDAFYLLEEVQLMNKSFLFVNLLLHLAENHGSFSG